MTPPQGIIEQYFEVPVSLFGKFSQGVAWAWISFLQIVLGAV